MIHDTDAALRAMFLAADYEGKTPEITFDAPTGEWSAKLGTKRVVNLFLHQINEQIETRVGGIRDVRDTEGRVVERNRPIRRYEMAYLVSAWATDVAEEHRILSSVLAWLSNWESLPPTYRSGSLADMGLPIPMYVGQPVLGIGPVSQWDIWGTLGSRPRTSFELVVSVPLIPTSITEIAPPAAARRFVFGLADGPEEPVSSPGKDAVAKEQNAAFHTSTDPSPRGLPKPSGSARPRARVVHEGAQPPGR